MSEAKCSVIVVGIGRWRVEDLQGQAEVAIGVDA